jgi:hypothetical protein
MAEATETQLTENASGLHRFDRDQDQRDRSQERETISLCV